MASLNKIWSGQTTTDESTTQGDYSAPDNWQPINIRTSPWTWTASGSGTGEYYLRNASSDPGISQPGNVQLDGANAATATLGSLTAGTWNYGDNDTLGYSTIYVRLSDDADPDSKADGFVTFTQVPVATDDVVIPAGARAISSGMAQSGVAIGDFVVEAGFVAGIGSATAYLKIDPDTFEYRGNGSASAYIDIGSAAITPIIHATPQPSGNAQSGLYLLGSAMAALEMRAGNVGLAVQFNETATVTTINQTGGTLKVGKGAAITTHNQRGGTSVLRLGNTLTNLNFDGGQCRTEGTAAITNVTLDSAGLLTLNSTGTITALTQNGANSTVDMLQSGQARTVTTWNFYGGTRKYDPASVTITNRSAPNGPVTEQVART